MKKINLNSMRLDILNKARKHIVFNGWNDNIFSLISKESKISQEEMHVLFPKGYKSLLELYLLNADQEMMVACKKIDLIRMKTSERVKEIILIRLKINENNKKIVRRTFFTLMLPQHIKISTLSLYNTVNKIWYLAGDNSTDFNFYTKRGILAGIYSSTIFYWINSKEKKLEETKIFLDKQLKNISKISRIKKTFTPLFNFAPKFFSFAKNFSNSKR